MKKPKIILAIFAVILVAGVFSPRWYRRQVAVAKAKELLKTAITHQSSKEQKAEVLAQCSKLMDLDFPPNTQLLFACALKGHFPKPYVCSIKLEINVNGFDFFIGEINKHSKIENHALKTAGSPTWISPYIFDYYNPDNVWQAENVKNKSVYSIVYDVDCGLPILDILIDLDRPDSVVIYFEYAAF